MLFQAHLPSLRKVAVEIPFCFAAFPHILCAALLVNPLVIFATHSFREAYL